MLRGALSNESRPTEPQDSGPTAKDSFLEDKPLSLSRQFENYELVIGKDGKAIELGRGAVMNGREKGLSGKRVRRRPSGMSTSHLSIISALLVPPISTPWSMWKGKL